VAILQDKVALITGGGTGIGLGIAKVFAAEGATVFITGRRSDVLEQAKKFIGAGAFAIQADVTIGDEVAALVCKVLDAGRGIDVLVNSAGIMRFSNLENVDEADWDEQMRVNAYAPWRCAKEVLPGMRERKTGSIINISSISGLRPNPGSGVYCSSKASLQMMSQVLALETAADNIRVNVLCPGAVEDTELADPIFGKENVQAFYPKLAGLHPLGRNGKPRDVGKAALFLASDDSSWITGAVIPVDGGRHLVMNAIQ
jgi:NAD(P)-dependent dehydrogenase (short-subunit alcohol dehydrogenase family)